MMAASRPVMFEVVIQLCQGQKNLDTSLSCRNTVELHIEKRVPGSIKLGSSSYSLHRELLGFLSSEHDTRTFST